jgi:hypothetical protein
MISTHTKERAFSIHPKGTHRTFTASSDPLKRVSGGGNENKTRSLVNELNGIECEDGVNTLSSHLRLAPVIPLPSNQSDMGLFNTLAST